MINNLFVFSSVWDWIQLPPSWLNFFKKHQPFFPCFITINGHCCRLVPFMVWKNGACLLNISQLRLCVDQVTVPLLFSKLNSIVCLVLTRLTGVGISDYSKTSSHLQGASFCHLTRLCSLFVCFCSVLDHSRGIPSGRVVIQLFYQSVMYKIWYIKVIKTYF